MWNSKSSLANYSWEDERLRETDGDLKSIAEDAVREKSEKLSHRVSKRGEEEGWMVKKNNLTLRRQIVFFSF